MRTTSSVESMHAIFGKSFPKRPNIYNFIENIKQFEYSKADTIRQLNKDNIVHKKKRVEDQKRDEKINRLSRLLSRQIISIKDFLNEMASDEMDESENMTEDSEESLETTS